MVKVNLTTSQGGPSWKLMVSTVITSLGTRGLVELFRIGQSVHHITISTPEHHRLNGEPHVTLEFNQNNETVWITYCRANLAFYVPLSEETVPFPAAVPTILRYLRHL